MVSHQSDSASKLPGRLNKDLDYLMKRCRQMTPEQQADYDAREKSQRETEARYKRAKILTRLAAQLGERYSRERVGPGKYTVYHKNQKPVVAKLRAFAADIPAMLEARANLILFGDIGTGKDHLMAHLLYLCADYGCDCEFVPGQELYARLRATMDKKAKEREEQVFEAFLRPQILAISDCFSIGGDLKPWRQEVLYRLIDKRYRALKQTWMTGNVKSIAEAEEELTEPVWDRLQEMAEVCFCEWPSHRERTKK